MTTRRQFLGSLATSMGLLGIAPRLAFAGGLSKRFIFVINRGGWDPLTVFAPMFGTATIDMEAQAVQATAGNIAYVDHANRPAVRAFFQQHYANTMVVQGINVRSLSHDICTQMILTGTTSSEASDWATAAADAASDRFTLPHVVIDGPVFAGVRGAVVAQAGGNNQLDQLLHGTMAVYLDQQPTGTAVGPIEGVLDGYMEQRAAAFAQAAAGTAREQTALDFQESLQRAVDLKAKRDDVSFGSGPNLVQQGATAVEVLRQGIARCVTVSGQGAWDTHVNNDNQSGLFNNLFGALSQLMTSLENTLGPEGQPLANDTVVVVLSEMGRTPRFNAADGRDHWPYTSALVVGPGITGDRVVGGYDELYYGRGIDPASGDIDDAGPILSAESFGATLLALADVDPGALLPSAEPLLGVLS